MKRFIPLILIAFLPVSPALSLPGDLTVVADSILENDCQGGSEAAIYISVLGGTEPYSFTWNGPLDYTSEQEDLEFLIEGAYSLTVTDQLDSTTTWDTIVWDSNPNATFIEHSLFGDFGIQCNGYSTGWIEIRNAIGNGPDSLYTFQWTGPDGFYSEERNPDSLVAGEYRYIITDTLGCSDTDTIVLTQPNELQFNMEGLKNVQCYGPEEGYLKLVASGGHGEYAYLWSGAVSSDSDSLSDLVTGKYIFEISDIQGCAVSDSLILAESDLVSITVDSIDRNPCLGLQLAAIYITGSGGEGGGGGGK